MDAIAEGAVCANIGPREYRIRMTFGVVGAIISVALFAGLVMMQAPRWTHALVMLPAGMAAAGFFQAFAHTCVAFAGKDIKVLGDSRKDAIKVSAAEKIQISKQARAVYRNMIIATLLVGAIALAVP